uniref:Uncharacterized protein n=1 Tax=Heterorhabditis bacteriophora TaxID=37862 RepID=A0A1I7XDG8_HETBA
MTCKFKRFREKNKNNISQVMGGEDFFRYRIQFSVIQTDMFAVIVIAVLIAFVAGSEQVKNATAGGHYDSSSFDDSYEYGSSYGSYPYGYQLPFNYYLNPMINTHVCSLDVTYGIYGGPGRRNFRRPVTHECANVFSGAHKTNASKNAWAYTQKHCTHCCKMAARLNSVPQVEIVGLMLVIDKHPTCSCCAPYRPPQFTHPHYQSNTAYQPPPQNH